MSVAILGLEDIGKDDIAIAGGKGANLGELAGKGFPVPPAFVISARACEDFFRHIELESHVERLKIASPDEWSSHCTSIRGLIEKADVPRDLADGIMAAHGGLIRDRGAEIHCAVRSSGTAEDLGDASFAGQHATYYYVDAEHLMQMVKHCWASLWTPEAVSYRSSQGIDHNSVFMAVVVQEMIMSEVSGVTFTANPVTGNRDEIMIESSWGMGAAIVDGRVTPDHYVVSREGFRLNEKKISEKRFMVPCRLDQGSNVRLREVPHGMRHKETLSKEQIRIIAEWAVKAEEHFGNPQDMEWAISNGDFYMLQSRPITVMGREEIGQGLRGKYVLFKSVIENFTEPLTPLTADLMRRAISLIPSIQVIKGWIYINLNHLRLLLPFKASEREMADLVYLSYGTEPPPMKLSLLRLPVTMLIFFIYYMLFGVTYARCRRMPNDFMDGFRELCRRVETDPSIGPMGTLARLWSWSRLFDPIGHMVLYVNISTALRYPIWRVLLNRVLRRWAPDIREDAEDLLCSGSEGVLSVEMGRGIWSLAREAKKHKRVRELFEKLKPDKLFDTLKKEPEAKEFMKQLDSFLSVHGHRALKEFELQSVRWEENPAPVLGMVRNYMLVDTDPTRHEEKVNRARSEIEEQIRKELEKYPLEKTFGFRYRLIQYIKERARYFTRQRENSRFYHIMSFNIARKKILKLEKDLMEEGKLKCKGDIFFMDMEELSRLRCGKIGWLDMEDKVRDRRMEYIRLSKMVPPKTIGVVIKEKAGIDKSFALEDSLFHGQSASPGSYKGIAHVIIDPSIDTELKPGEILIAPYTDPAWTPLFLTAGAAVVEVGSYLSHAGTVAREFGMPCVVDVSDCTRRIHSGDHVKVDGDHGTVKLEQDDGGEEP